MSLTMMRVSSMPTGIALDDAALVAAIEERALIPMIASTTTRASALATALPQGQRTRLVYLCSVVHYE
jgi:hypothetical protein